MCNTEFSAGDTVAVFDPGCGLSGIDISVLLMAGGHDEAAAGSRLDFPLLIDGVRTGIFPHAAHAIEGRQPERQLGILSLALNAAGPP